MMNKYDKALEIGVKLYNLMKELDYYNYLDYKELENQEIKLLTLDILSGKTHDINELLTDVVDTNEDKKILSRVDLLKDDINKFSVI